MPIKSAHTIDSVGAFYWLTVFSQKSSFTYSPAYKILRKTHNDVVREAWVSVILNK